MAAKKSSSGRGRSSARKKPSATLMLKINAYNKLTETYVSKTKPLRDSIKRQAKKEGFTINI